MKIRGVAHRGYPALYPENTLSSFDAACKLGFETLEFDVHLSKDGIPVVMHDVNVDRVTNGKGDIKDLTLLELKALRVREIEKIPTLAEALSLVKGRIKVLIELKQMGHLYPQLEEKVLNVIREFDMENEVCLISFDHYSVARLRKLSDAIELGPLILGATPTIFPFMKEINAKYLVLQHKYMTDEYVQVCKQNGANLIVWAVDSEEDMQRMAHYPSVLCATNELEKFKSFHEKNNQL